MLQPMLTSALNKSHQLRSILGAIGLVIGVLFGTTMVACAQKYVRASDLIRSYLRMESGIALTDENIKNAALKVAPLGMSISEIFDKMAKTGLGPGHCAPGEIDGTEFSGLPYCEIRSSENSCGDEYVNYNIYFVLTKRSGIKDLFEPGATRLQDIKVQRWTRPCS